MKRTDETKRITGIIGSNEAGLPVVAVVREGAFLIFWCDHCNKYHIHGGVGFRSGAGDGHRESHCPSIPGSYVIVEVTP